MVYHTAAQVATLRKVSVDVILASNRLNIERLYGVTKNMIAVEEIKYCEDRINNRNFLQRTVVNESPKANLQIARRKVVYDENDFCMKGDIITWLKGIDKQV